jgi:hypothetical protein
MLFRTVYGPELEAIYRFIVAGQDLGRQRQDIYTAFIPKRTDEIIPSTQSVDDALAFLKSARLIQETDGFHAYQTPPEAFAVKLLRAMRKLEIGAEQPEHHIDPLYTLLLTELFIEPDRLFVKNLYAEANQLRQVREAGGLTKEKVQVWKRVMEFLGIGRRAFGGFLCAYMPDLMLAIINQWTEERGTLQSFFDYLDQVLPCARSDGELARPVAASMLYLAEQGKIELFPLQDSPTRPYFGTLGYRWIARRHGND